MGSGELGFGLKLSKWLVFAQNFVFFLGGAAVICFAAYLLLGGPVISTLHLIKSITIGMLSIGALILFVSFFGCCGSARESRGLLGVYFFLVLLLVLAFCGACIVAFTGLFQTDDLIEQAWEKTDNSTRYWIYENLECCGLTKPENSTICEEVEKKFNVTQLPKCITKLQTWIIEHVTIVEIVGISFGAFLIVGMILTCCLLFNIPSEKQRKKEEKKKLLKQAREMNNHNYDHLP